MTNHNQGIDINAIVQQKEFEIISVYNQAWTSNVILYYRAQKPGLALAGYLKYLDANRIQVFGKTETGYLLQLPEAEFERRLTDYLARKVPGIIVSENQEAPPAIVQLADQYRTPVLISALKSSVLIPRLSNFLYRHFTEKIKLNGVFMDIMGQGILICGPSGIGKSETALELVSRGNHLVCDDLVEFYVNPNDELIGRSIERIRRWIEVRGLGIINIVDMFGFGALVDEKKLDLVIQLEPWDPKKKYERLGVDQLYFNILGKEIPMFNIPVGVGRNLSTLIEVAVKYFISRQSGGVSFVDYIEQNGKERS
ncbi:MAG: HPr(Ser) kinase/phosphatase [Candidatus Omnitrophota bacterium]